MRRYFADYKLASIREMIVPELKCRMRSSQQRWRY